MRKGREMKTFSVRFYKRLILVFLALLIVVPMVFAIVFGIQNAKLNKRVNELEAGKAPGVVNTAVPMDPSSDPTAVPTSYDNPLIGEALYYQTLYPELYGTATVTSQRDNSADTVYLTFDCAPSGNTLEILDILDEYGVKATFFVMGTTDAEYQDILKEIVQRGHTIGLRSYSGSLQEIYHSVVDYLDDFKKIYDLVYETTGVKAEIFRFPRGSVNGYNGSIYEELIAEMLRRNFIFFDWNVSAGSSDQPEEIANNVINSMANLNRGIVMFQDMAGNEGIIGALPTIIATLQEQGFQFAPLSAQVLPVIFSYR